MMKRTIITFLLCMLFSSPLAAIPIQNPSCENPSERGPMICQELMTPEFSIGEGDEEMELPPLKFNETPAPASVDSQPLKRVPRSEREVVETQEVTSETTVLPQEASPTLLTLPEEMEKEVEEKTVTAPLPLMPLESVAGATPEPPDEGMVHDAGTPLETGISPLVLPQPTKLAEQELPPMEPGEKSGEEIIEEVKVPAKLKTVQSKSAELKSLKMPSEEAEGLYAESAENDLPLLEGDEKAKVTDSSSGERTLLARTPVSITTPSLDRKLDEIYLKYYGRNALLKQGDRGIIVERVQKALQDRGYYQGPFHGRFTGEMTRAVIEFQGDARITVDGIVGPVTMKTMGLY